jgi:hypothetical protein
MDQLKCTVCNAREASACPICKSAAYCTETCKQKDERLHKMICQDFATFTIRSPKPSEDAVLAILLDSESSVPRLIWVAGRTERNMKIVVEGEEFNKPIMHDYLGPGKPRPERISFTSHKDPNFSLDHTVAFDYRDSFFYDGSKTNLCVATMCDGQYRHRWCGQMVVVSWPGLKSSSRYYQDVTAADLSYVTDYFRRYGDGLGVNEKLTFNDHPVDFSNYENPKFNTFVQNLVRGKVKESSWGVKISCEGDKKLLKEPQFTGVEITAAHPIFNLETTSISVAMGLPIVTWKLDPHPLWSHDNGASFNYEPYQNDKARTLNLDVGVSSSTVGKVDKKQWGRSRIGSVWVVRADRKDITVQQVEALAEYCNQLNVAVSAVLGREKATELKENEEARSKLFKEHLCKEKFEVFFEKMKAKKIKKGDQSWAFAVSSYSV